MVQLRGILLLYLRGLTPDASYRVTDDTGREIGVWTGAVLMHAGMRAPIPQEARAYGQTDYAAFQFELERLA